MKRISQSSHYLEGSESLITRRPGGREQPPFAISKIASLGVISPNVVMGVFVLTAIWGPGSEIWPFSC